MSQTCLHSRTRVMDSRQSQLLGVKTIRRRRRCLKCNHRFTTYEVTIEQVASFQAANAKIDIINRVDEAMHVIQQSVVDCVRKRTKKRLPIIKKANQKLSDLEPEQKRYYRKMIKNGVSRKEAKQLTGAKKWGRL